MNILIAVLALSFCTAAAAQGMNKCRDAAGKITYASQECEDLGLKPAGPIQDRSSVAPAQRVPPPARPSPAVKAAPAPAAQSAPAPATEDPERRCFKTAKGFRCNDVPEKN
jgi:hypothetical protein